MRPTARLGAACLTAAALLTGPLLTGPATADVTADPVIEVLPVEAPHQTPGVVDGPFDMVVRVTGGGQDDIVLRPQLPFWAASAPSAPTVTVPGGTCPDSCLVSWRLDPADQATPWYPGSTHLEVVAVMAGRSLTTTGTGVLYAAPVQPSWVSAATATPTVNTPGYAAAVFDVGGEVTFAGMNGRDAGEDVVVSVLPAEGDLGATPLTSVVSRWSDIPTTGYATGHAALDTSSLPEGWYRLLARAHDAAGHWSYATPQPLVVRHSPIVLVAPGGSGSVADSTVAAGRSIGVTVTVQAPRATQKELGEVRVTAAGVETTYPGGVLEWHVPADRKLPSSRVLSLDTTGLPVGDVPLDVEVFDADGAVVASASSTIHVADFHDSVDIPTLVVGRPSSLHVRAIAPEGTAFSRCHIDLDGPGLATQLPDTCTPPGATTIDATPSVVPHTAGTANLHVWFEMLDGAVGPDRRIPITVYANRTATLTAPARATWGTTQRATVTVRDERAIPVWSAAGAGILVTLQRQRAGTTTWVTIGSARTATNGVAQIPFGQTTSGHLRAVVTGSVPGTTVTTAQRWTTSVATVRWSWLPATARAGSLVAGSVYAKPYEAGARVRFQARRLGTRTWRTFGYGTVGRSGYARASARLRTRGTWRVRIQRLGTTTQGTAYTVTRGLRII